jgi:hypothetical protein
MTGGLVWNGHDEPTEEPTTEGRRWYWKFPLDAYALGPCGPFRNETESRAAARDFDGCKRLPAGFETWPTD